VTDVALLIDSLALELALIDLLASCTIVIAEPIW